MKIKLLTVLLLLVSVSLADVVTIAEARAAVGDTVTVEGIVTTPSWSPGYTSYQIQDATGGLNLFYYSKYVALSIGDLVNVTGKILLYNGLTEVEALHDSLVKVISTGNDAPISQPLTLSALLNDPETFESELVVIENVSITSGTWPASGSSATLKVSDDGGRTVVDLRIDNDTDIDGAAQPTGAFVLTGVLSQYDGSAPYDEGYQIMPRSYADFGAPFEDVVTFAEARADSGNTVTVRGFITTPSFSSSSNDFGFQDATGGLDLYASGSSVGLFGVEYGDFVQATGKIGDYNGKREIMPTDTLDVTILYRGTAVPAPIELTLRELLTDPETYEGMLVQVVNVTYTGTWPLLGTDANLTITDPSDTSMTMRIDKDHEVDGTAAPVGAFNLIGWLQQYDSSSPYTSGYQLSPRFPSDIVTFENQAPVIVDVSIEPTPVYDGDAVTVTAEITDDGTFTVSLTYNVGAGDVVLAMTHTTGDLYTAEIPGQDEGTLVTYSVAADDGALVTDSGDLTYLVLASAGTVTPIYDIQYSATGTSPLNGTVVTISGIVTAEFWGSYKNRYLYVQDAASAWSGIYCFEYGGWNNFNFNSASGLVNTVAEGDSIAMTGTVTEYTTGNSTVTELTDVTAVTIYSSGHTMESTLVTPGQVNTGGTEQEAYEGVLVKIADVTVAREKNSYGEWLVTDGTDTLMVDDIWSYYYWPKVGDEIDEIVGVMDFAYSEAKLQPRLARDVVEKGVCRIQRIQQVLYSDLLKTGRLGADGLIDHVSDISYMNWIPNVDSTFVTIEGIVTMPTELGYAGAGIKVIYEDVHGGPWSGILSYSPDSTGIPILWEGDTVSAYGYISEYQTDHGNMTEFFGSDVLDVIGWGEGVHGVGIPPAAPVATGDLRWPETAEQWGNVMVKLSDLTVTKVNPAGSNLNSGMFAVSDGSGEIWIDHDSWVIFDWWEITGPPAVGAAIDSIIGWVYHHFDTYSDTGVTVYKVVPIYVEDIYFPVVGVAENAPLPKQYALNQNYPNPFNPTTAIQFELADAQRVKMIVYDVLGRQVRTLVSSDMPAGTFTVVWDGNNNHGQMVSTGVYFVRLVAGDFVSVKKMTLLR
ncbi:MAG: DUF5689 domain-containing protein [Candidatus Neomarinimicrobiota bacterium]